MPSTLPRSGLLIYAGKTPQGVDMSANMRPTPQTSGLRLKARRPDRSLRGHERGNRSGAVHEARGRESSRWCVRDSAAMCTGNVLFCMRVTLNVDDELYRRIRRRKADTGQTITALVHDAVLMYFARCVDEPKPDTDLPVFHGTGVLPGIDLYSNSSLAV